ncbi:beta-ketoacyl synthase N-terminal-like domain-containing protein [Chromobacterium sp. ATCC 53434]|uniref:beta-ketoacyl synthase N-terminal-like domain-containing protein n=1 Tax=Chromobacterium sp. (strain ATCC 53434 / SC 14030) TaxID=2059672 RepID=UPI0021011A89|nr:beta-ketoacyl synthase N-terminal-like domain-containing protein [Chromobacterium sp. ATCC 53434]
MVTGMGIVGGAGIGVERFTDALRNGRGRFSAVRAAPSSRPAYVMAELEPFRLDEHLPSALQAEPSLAARLRKVGGRSTRVAQAGLLAVAQAWCQAGFPAGGERTALVVGGQNLSHAFEAGWSERFAEEPAYLSPSAAIQMLDSDLIGCVSEVFGMQGEGYAVGGASASGNVAILNGLRLIRSGDADVCVVVGALAELSPFQLQAFANLGALGGEAYLDEPERACRPFDRRHNGFIPGQASACLVLEAESHALARGAPALGRVLGGAMSLDGNRGANPSVAGEAGVMRRALANAGVPVDAVEYVNAHGSSSSLGDITELKAIERAFGAHGPNVLVNSTKSISGHCLWSAGVVEALACLVQINAGFLHGNLNLTEPIEHACALLGPDSRDIGVRIAMSNSFGFGGINTSLVLASPSLSIGSG